MLSTDMSQSYWFVHLIITFCHTDFVTGESIPPNSKVKMILFHPYNGQCGVVSLMLFEISQVIDQFAMPEMMLQAAQEETNS